MMWQFFRANKKLRKLPQGQEINMNSMHGEKEAYFKGQDLNKENKFEKISP
jgi:hypothetical protein